MNNKVFAKISLWTMGMQADPYTFQASGAYAFRVDAARCLTLAADEARKERNVPRCL